MASSPSSMRTEALYLAVVAASAAVVVVVRVVVVVMFTLIFVTMVTVAVTVMVAELVERMSLCGMAAGGAFSGQVWGGGRSCSGS